MKKFLITFYFILSALTYSQSQFQQFIDYVNSLGDPSLKQAAVDSFMTYARTQGIPFIEDSTANFIYQGNPSSVSVPGDFKKIQILAREGLVPTQNFQCRYTFNRGK
ncbi:MAG: hypothetical protein DYG97_10115 [Ignavibacteria bacterium CHB3]|nr:hypothetical protein [Ignavibacteria bacterium CHB3]